MQYYSNLIITTPSLFRKYGSKFLPSRNMNSQMAFMKKSLACVAEWLMKKIKALNSPSTGYASRNWYASGNHLIVIYSSSKRQKIFSELYSDIMNFERQIQLQDSRCYLCWNSWTLYIHIYEYVYRITLNEQFSSIDMTWLTHYRNSSQQQ